MSKYSDAVKAIRSNYPPEQYTQLREALTTSIRLLNKEENKECDVQMKHVILNGWPSSETLDEYQEKGWHTLMVATAKEFHPYAMDTDTILFIAKPINKESYDKWMDESSAFGNIPDSE